MITFVRAIMKSRSNILIRQMSTLAKESAEITNKNIDKPNFITRSKNLTIKIGNYFLKIGKDYQIVGQDTLKDMKEAPLKSALYISLLAGTIYLMKTNPSEANFKCQLMEYSLDLCNIGEPIRSKNSDDHIQAILQAYNQGRVRHLNFGVASVIWLSDFERECDVYPAVCKPSRIRWLDVFGYGDMPSRVIDVGVAGRFLRLDKSVIDYDINDTEWSNKPE